MSFRKDHVARVYNYISSRKYEISEKVKARMKMERTTLMKLTDKVKDASFTQNLVAGIMIAAKDAVTRKGTDRYFKKFMDELGDMYRWSDRMTPQQFKDWIKALIYTVKNEGIEDLLLELDRLNRRIDADPKGIIYEDEFGHLQELYPDPALIRSRDRIVLDLPQEVRLLCLFKWFLHFYPFYMRLFTPTLILNN